MPQETGEPRRARAPAGGRAAWPPRRNARSPSPNPHRRGVTAHMAAAAERQGRRGATQGRGSGSRRKHAARGVLGRRRPAYAATSGRGHVPSREVRTGRGARGDVRGRGLQAGRAARATAGPADARGGAGLPQPQQPPVRAGPRRPGTCGAPPGSTPRAAPARTPGTAGPARTWLAVAGAGGPEGRGRWRRRQEGRRPREVRTSPGFTRRRAWGRDPGRRRCGATPRSRPEAAAGANGARSSWRTAPPCASVTPAGPDSLRPSPPAPAAERKPQRAARRRQPRSRPRTDQPRRASAGPGGPRGRSRSPRAALGARLHRRARPWFPGVSDPTFRSGGCGGLRAPRLLQPPYVGARPGLSAHDGSPRGGPHDTGPASRRGPRGAVVQALVPAARAGLPVTSSGVPAIRPRRRDSGGLRPEKGLVEGPQRVSNTDADPSHQHEERAAA